MAKATNENAKKTAKAAEYTVDIPEGVTITIEGKKVKAKGSKGEITKTFDLDGVKTSQDGKKLTLTPPSNRKTDKASAGAIRSHIQNMAAGVTDGVTYKMKIVYSHFPMNAKVQGDKMVIDNFLGEKYPRKTQILKNVTVEIKGQDVTLKGIDLDHVSQTAANIEQITRIKGRDPRVFQDGIYITEKNGKPLR